MELRRFRANPDGIRPAPSDKALFTACSDRFKLGGFQLGVARIVSESRGKSL